LYPENVFGSGDFSNKGWFMKLEPSFSLLNWIDAVDNFAFENDFWAEFEGVWIAFWKLFWAAFVNDVWSASFGVWTSFGGWAALEFEILHDCID
jgi:hypothetical protein